MHIGTGATPSKAEAMCFPPPRRLYSDADASRQDALDYLGNPVGFIDFSTEFKYLDLIVHHSLTSDEDVDMRIRSASAVFGALKNILTNKDIDLKVKESVYVTLCSSIPLYGSEIGAYGKTCSIAFASFITDALEPCATLPSLTQFATVFHLQASLNAFRLSPSTNIIIIDFFDGQTTSPGSH
jgi:hypothetical protein